MVKPFVRVRTSIVCLQYSNLLVQQNTQPIHRYPSFNKSLPSLLQFSKLLFSKGRCCPSLSTVCLNLRSFPSSIDRHHGRVQATEIPDTGETVRRIRATACESHTCAIGICSWRDSMALGLVSCKTRPSSHARMLMRIEIKLNMTHSYNRQ